MSLPSNAPMRVLLARAVNSRSSYLSMGWSRKGVRDTTAMRTAIDTIMAWLSSYPNASDQRTITWCRANERIVRMVIPGKWTSIEKKLFNVDK